MDRLLNKLERRFGRFHIEGLTYILVVAQAFVFLLSLIRPEGISALMMDREAVLGGQVWRLLTYLFIPRTFHPIWIIFALYWLYTMGTALEAQWGPFKYMLFWIVGIVLTTIAAFTLDVQVDNTNLLLALFLAFATIFPDFELRLFFILPVKVKYLAWVGAAGLVVSAGLARGYERLFPLLAVGNYLLFFGGHLYQMLRQGAGRPGRVSRNHAFRRDAQKAGLLVRKCSLCGITNADPNAEFRICTCEKCGGKPTEFCLAHARNH
jgi:membrane associated rhomboid family serine protease